METAVKKSSAAAYHHGDLRNALIIAAAELIEESGSDDFAMTDAARRAGVSNAAPYRHFCDRDDLLRAVAELGYFDLSNKMNLIAEQYEVGTTDAILEMGKFYLHYVLEKKAFFDLMWGERGSATLQKLDAEHENFRTNGFWMLVNQVQAWLEREGVNSEDAANLALKLWAMSIGTAHMALNYDLDFYVQNIDLDEIVVSSTLAFLRGAQENRGAATPGDKATR